MQTVGFRITGKLEERLGRFAGLTRRSISDIAREAMEEYLDRYDDDRELQRQLRLVAEMTTEEELDRLDATHAELMRDEPDYDWGTPRP